MYHRLSQSLPDIDPWRLTVSIDNFDRQMKLLASTRLVLSLSEFTSAYKTATLPHNAAAVTFDDGYADNLLLAKPVLRKYGIPATVFIVTDALGDRAFWWDRLAYAINSTEQLPDRVVFHNGKYVLPLDLDKAGNKGDALHRLWSSFRDISTEDRNKFLGQLEQEVGAVYPSSGARPLTVREVSELADDFVEIGSHTVTHPWLPAICDRKVLRQEILESRQVIKELVGYTPKLFSYPYGAHTNAVRNEVVESGYRAAVTVTSSAVQANADLYLIPRLAVDDDMNHFIQLIGPNPCKKIYCTS
jgi:peptidoglycan/xylan/chitin deacetylase (PgdA/CDA1 family)